MTQDLRYRDLPDAVRNLRVEQLGQLLRQVDVAAPTHKNDRVDAVMKQLEGERLRALWARLGPLEKTAVAETVHSADRAFDVDRFVAKHGRAPAALVRDDDRSRDSMSLLNFFFYGNVMPLELMNRLLEFVPKPDPATLATVDEIPTSFEKPRSLWDPETKQRGKSTEKAPVVVRETERAALREVQAVLRLVDAGKIAVGDATKRPTASAMKAVSAVLEGGDFYDDARDAAVGPIKAFAWPMLVQQAGLAKSSGGRLALTRAGLQALSAEPAEVIRSIWARWISSKLLDELSRVDTIKGQTGKGKRGLTDPVDRRIAIENGLRECPAHRWIAVDEFFRYLRAADNDFEVTRDPWRLYFSEPRYDSLGYAGFHDWKILQARYALCFLFEYAATLGLLDVAYVTPDRARHDYGSLGGADEFVFLSRYDGLRYIRLTALSASCWGDETYAAPPREARSVLRVLPNLEIVASGGELAPADRLALDGYAKRVSDAVWRLDAPILYAALEDGRSVNDVREFLTSRNGEPLPATVARFLDDLAERAGRIRDRGLARLIECDDPSLAALVAHDTRAKRLCLLAGERTLVVKAADESAFRRAVREMGYPLSRPSSDRPRASARGEKRRDEVGTADLKWAHETSNTSDRIRSSSESDRGGDGELDRERTVE